MNVAFPVRRIKLAICVETLCTDDALGSCCRPRWRAALRWDIPLYRFPSARAFDCWTLQHFARTARGSPGRHRPRGLKSDGGLLEAICAHHSQPSIRDELAALLMLGVSVHDGVFFGLPVEPLELVGALNVALLAKDALHVVGDACGDQAIGHGLAGRVHVALSEAHSPLAVHRREIHFSRSRRRQPHMARLSDLRRNDVHIDGKKSAVLDCSRDGIDHAGAVAVWNSRHLWLAPCKPGPSHGHLLDFRPVLRNRAALGYILGCGAHCFELYGMRTWIVAFWTFVLAQSGDSALVGPITVSVIVTLLSLPASILGNEAALRFGRHRAITVVMIASAGVALAIGLNAGSSPLLLLPLVIIYGVTIPADSGALTSGTTASATLAYRGATLALHSAVGFGLSALGGWGAGVALDAAGGPGRPAGWLALFALLAAGVLLGPIALRWSQRDR
jgi:hypothetical protein